MALAESWEPALRGVATWSTLVSPRPSGCLHVVLRPAAGPQALRARVQRWERMPRRRRPLSAHCGRYLLCELSCPTSCSD
eukprot:4195377-Pyramimonas_sp.AAC.1